MLIVSLFFYSWGEPRYIVLIMVSIVINWGIALLLVRYTNWHRSILAIGVGINLAGLGVFKYASFLIGNLDHVLSVNLPAPNISLPIGISFYTFQAISYLVDVYKGQVTVQKNPFFFGAYLALFPKLLAGPIVRYKHIATEMVSRRENLEDFTQGLRRFIIGLGKMVLIANTMGSIADKILSTGPYVGAIPAWIGFIAYTFQIYFDFSAYSDMAIGLGQMFGFHFLENFNYPYVARSVTEFWRRWHISLSAFFRYYVYIPMGGNRVSRGRWVVNLAIVWAITGLWHGASWNFVLWGLYYGVLLACEKLFLMAWMERWPRFLQHAFVILCFVFGWVIFRIADFSMIGGWLGSMFGAYGWGHPMTLNALNILHKYPWFIIAAIGSTPMVGNFLKNVSKTPLGSVLVDLWLSAILVWSILEVALGGFSPFIYFQF
ncbi:MAG: MBOAT family protein [Deltaproteobacteria bacterium]|nr:MBOAT family protein [Deltaproteobacteria bacterium]